MNPIKLLAIKLFVLPASAIASAVEVVRFIVDPDIRREDKDLSVRGLFGTWLYCITSRFEGHMLTHTREGRQIMQNQIEALERRVKEGS